MSVQNAYGRTSVLFYSSCGCRGRDRMVVESITTYMQSMPIATNVVSSNPVQVYSIQHTVIKFVSDLRHVGGFLRFPPPIKLTTHDITEILLKVALYTITLKIEIISRMLSFYYLVCLCNI